MKSTSYPQSHANVKLIKSKVYVYYLLEPTKRIASETTTDSTEDVPDATHKSTWANVGTWYGDTITMVWPSSTTEQLQKAEEIFEAPAQNRVKSEILTLEIKTISTDWSQGFWFCYCWKHLSIEECSWWTEIDSTKTRKFDSRCPKTA